jgi:hypothetical protein
MIQLVVLGGVDGAFFPKKIFFRFQKLVKSTPKIIQWNIFNLFFLRLTDLCEYCERAISLKRLIGELLKRENHPFSENYDVDLLLKEFKQKSQTMNSINNNANESPDRFLQIKQLIEYLEEYCSCCNYAPVIQQQKLGLFE